MTNQSLAQKRADQVAAMPPKQQVAAMLKANKNAISQVLPRHISPERLMQVAFSAVRTTPKLLECDQSSLIGSVIQCAQLGLEPNTVLGHAYLVPFWNSQKKRREVQVIVGYKGLIDLARRSGQIVSIAAHVVHEHDVFEFEYGLEPKLRHVPTAGAARGEITHAYAVAHLKDGGNAFEVMPVEDIRALMLQTQSKGEYGPWSDNFAEMARKTVIRRLSKFLPLSIEFATAVAMDAQASAGEDQHLDDILTGEYEVTEPAGADEPESKAEALKDRLRREDKPRVDPPAGRATEPVANDDKPESSDDGTWPKLVDGDLIDSGGEVFSREFHVVDDDDCPVMNKDGSFRKRPGAAAKLAENDDQML